MQCCACASKLKGQTALPLSGQARRCKTAALSHLKAAARAHARACVSRWRPLCACPISRVCRDGGQWRVLCRRNRSPAGQASPCPRKPQKIGDFRHLHARNHAHAPVHGLQSNARAFRQWLGGGGVFGCAKGATPVAGRWAGRCCSHELYDLCGACGRKQIAVGPSVLLWCPVRG